MLRGETRSVRPPEGECADTPPGSRRAVGGRL